MRLDAALADIAHARRGPKTAAFFDFDGTIIAGYSALALISRRARRGQIGPQEVARLIWVGVEASRGRAEFADVMAAAARGFAGTSAAKLEEMGAALLKGALGGQLHPEAWQLVAAHRRRGHTVVIASSAFPFQVEPLAEELGIEHVLCTRLEQRDGVMTGGLDGSVLWGQGKADAVRRYAVDSGVTLTSSFGYANGDEDVEFLSAVGRPRPINPGKRLAKVARRQGWPTLRFAARGRPGVGDVVRTVAAGGGLATAVGAGLGLGLLNRSRRDAVNLTMSAGSAAALGLAGIDLAVQGEEHLWTERPAVLIFNHQSRLDGLIVMKLVRFDVTAEAKVERLAEGTSIAIAPEGARSSTPRVAPFKVGAFHLARQAAVPVVPIVIRNAGELLWRGSTFTRPGTIDVVVLPPIAVADWPTDDVERRVEELHARFVDTLADWPKGTTRLRAVPPDDAE